MASPYSEGRVRYGHGRKIGKGNGKETNLGDVPLHAVRDHPALPQRRPVPFHDGVLGLVIDGRVGRAVVHARLARDDHVALETAEHGATDDGGPGIHGLHHLDGWPLAGVDVGGGRALAVGGRRGAGEVVLEAAVEVVALAEPADEDDARDDAAFGAEGVDLPLDEVADLLHDGLKDFLDLVGRHDEESRVEADCFVVWEAGEPGRVSRGLGSGL